MMEGTSKLKPAYRATCHHRRVWIEAASTGRTRTRAVALVAAVRVAASAAVHKLIIPWLALPPRRVSLVRLLVVLLLLLLRRRLVLLVLLLLVLLLVLRRRLAVLALLRLHL